jgi:hypothetical protein
MTFSRKILTSFYIIKHKAWVMFFLFKIMWTLFKRGLRHDLSKFSKEEFEYVYILSTKGVGVKFGSKEYYDLVDCVLPAKEAHAARNRHHLEFYGNCIDKMSVLDRIEMMADWLAAGHRSGTKIADSLNINTVKYKIPNGIRVGLERDFYEIGC